MNDVLKNLANLKNIPIILETNPLTGLRWGNDDGYKTKVKNVKSLHPLVHLQGVETRPYFDGYSEYGTFDVKKILAGGLENNLLYVRESLAYWIEEFQRIMNQTNPLQKLVAVDGFRSEVRQKAGFTKYYFQELQRIGIDNPKETLLRPSQIYECGERVDLNSFACINANKDSLQYKNLVNDLNLDNSFIEEVVYIAKKDLKSGDSLKSAVDDTLFKIISISASSDTYPAKGRNIPLDSQNNCHRTGGSADIISVDVSNNKPLYIIPLDDYIGEETPMDYLEDPKNFQKFKEKLSQNIRLQNHLKKMGYINPDSFSINDWNYYRDLQRERFWISKILGGTIYDGEFWHFNSACEIVDLHGNVISKAKIAVEIKNRNSGNAAHSIQTQGPKKGIAVWDGNSAEAYLKSKKLLRSV